MLLDQMLQVKLYNHSPSKKEVTHTTMPALAPIVGLFVGSGGLVSDSEVAWPNLHDSKVYAWKFLSLKVV